MSFNRQSQVTRRITYIAMGVAILTVCSWLTVPYTVNFTMQTFAVFLITAVYPPKYSALTLLAYLLLGVMGIPVFSGFQGGYGVLLGASGGYLIGLWGIVLMAVISKTLRRDNTALLGVFLFLGLLLCYAVGTVWYSVIYRLTANLSVWGLLSICVFPFIIPDVAKLLLALSLSRRLRFISFDSGI